MYSINFSKTGGPEVLKYEKLSISEPKENEVLIKHSAIGLNFIDTYHRSGLYPVPLPSGIGLEGAGIIEKVGPSVKNFKEGDFSPAERESILKVPYVKSFTISKNILRSDTAVITAISLVNFVYFNS